MYFLIGDSVDSLSHTIQELKLHNEFFLKNHETRILSFLKLERSTNNKNTIKGLFVVCQ